MEISEWYKSRMVQFQIYENVLNRETFFKDAEGKMHIRALNIFSTQGIEYNIESCGFNKSKFNFYASVAQIDWSQMGKVPTDKKLWKAYRDELSSKFESMVTGYDFAIDIDKPDIMDAYEVAKKVKVLFDECEVPYYVLFSGGKGFHFKVAWEDLKDSVNCSPVEFVKITKELGKLFAERVGFEYGSDIDNIYDLRRVIRVPYSIHPKTGYVVLPLTDEQFNNFKPEDYTIDSVMKNVHLLRRGLCKRNPGKNRDFVLQKLLSV